MNADIEDTLKALAELDAKLQKKVIRKALTKASKVAVNDLKGRVEDDSGILKKSIQSKVSVKGGKGRALIGASNTVGTGKNKSKGASRYFHLSESKGIKGKSKAESVKKVAEKLESTLSSTSGRMAAIVENEIKQGLEGNN